VEDVSAVVPGVVDRAAVSVPEPELPQPDTIPTANKTTATYIAFIIDFIISPLSVVAPVWTIENRGLGIE
jgi:hypothetical protein